MGGMSPFHWLVVVLVIVLLFGAKRIPELASSLGKGIKEFKKAQKDADAELTDATDKDKGVQKKE